MKPEDIEALSFQIIDTEAGAHTYPPDQWTIVRRIIHTSADFDYLRSVRFHPEAVAAGLAAIRSGKPMFTDTRMAQAGIRRADLQRFGVTVTCYINEARVAETAAQHQITRAQAAVDLAVPELAGGIYVVGNAPTALLRIIDRVNDRSAAPSLIIGFPVGFVNAAESKAALLTLDCPYITNVGRKGGSNIAAGVVNALVRLAQAEPSPP
jgi:precorrin-8X/cobalt-precorrin-8 methylmutase